MKKTNLILFFAGALAFAALAILTVADHTGAFNVALASQIQSLQNPALTAFMKFISNVGDWPVYVPAAILLLILPKIRVKTGIPAALALAISFGLNRLLKLLFRVPRPDILPLIQETGYGFPSGHAMTGAAFVLTAAVLLTRCSKKPTKIWTISAAASFVLLVGFSRIYLGVHSVADVLAGYAAGLCICTAGITVFSQSYSVRRPLAERRG